MMTIFNVPVEVYQAYSAYAIKTGEEVYVNDLCIGNDARAYIHAISTEEGELKFTPIYITHDLHSTIMDRCNSDTDKVNKFMEELSEVYDD